MEKNHEEMEQAAASTCKSGDASSVILIVEDEWLLREQIADDLRQEGWEVLEASSGEKALTYMGAGQHIDLLMTDIRLAGPLNGWDVAQSYREVEWELPVIYTTANTRDVSRMVPGSFFLGKPIQISALLDTCRNLLRR